MHYGRQRETVEQERCQVCNRKLKGNPLFGMDLPWTTIHNGTRKPVIREPLMCADCILRALKSNGALKRRYEMRLLDVFEVSGYTITAVIRERTGDHWAWRPGSIDHLLGKDEKVVEFLNCILDRPRRVGFQELIQELEGQEKSQGTAENSLQTTVYDVREIRQRLDRLLAMNGTIVQITANLLEGADGESCGGLIKLRPGLSEDQELKVLLHETAHEILHPKRLVGKEVPIAAAIGMEVQAEAVSLMVRCRLGIDAGLYSAEYIHLHNFPLKGGETDLLTASLDGIAQTSEFLLNSLFARS
jgi:hypothetical protein